MSFHGPIEPERKFDPFSVYWTPAQEVDARDVTDLLQWAVSTWENTGPLIFLQSGVFDGEDALPCGHFEAAVNELTGEICGAFAFAGAFRPVWTSAPCGDREGAMQKIHDRYVELGILAGSAGE